MRLFVINAILLASGTLAAYGLWLFSHALAYTALGLSGLVAAFIVGVRHGDEHRP